MSTKGRKKKDFFDFLEENNFVTKKGRAKLEARAERFIKRIKEGAIINHHARIYRDYKGPGD